LVVETLRVAWRIWMQGTSQRGVACGAGVVPQRRLAVGCYEPPLLLGSRVRTELIARRRVGPISLGSPSTGTKADLSATGAGAAYTMKKLLEP
jgi:hypothetical protein